MNDNQLNQDINILSNEMKNKLISMMILSNVDELTNKLIESIKPIMVEYLIELKRKILSGEEFMTVKRVSSLTNVPIPTLYRWVASGLLKIYSVENINVISISEVKAIIGSKSYKFKAKLKSKSKTSEPIEDS